MTYQILIGDREPIEWPLLIPPTPEQASKVYLHAWGKTDNEGCSTFPEGYVVFDYTGRRLMRISYNGRVWDTATGELLYTPEDSPEDSPYLRAFDEIDRASELAQDVARAHGQLFDNISHMAWFRQAVADAIGGGVIA